MSRLVDILNTLKNELVSINKEVPLTSDITSLQNTSLAHMAYANPALLPTGIEPESAYISSIETEYAQKTLQAIYNIVDVVITGGIPGLIKDARFYFGANIVKKSLDFLDNKTWVPKIIDATTYKLGEAVKKALNSLLNDPIILSEIPEQKRKNAIDYLKKMSALLALRLEIFTRHTSENILTVITAVNLKKEKKEERNQILQQVSQYFENARKFNSKNKEILKENLAGNPENILIIIDQLKSKIKDTDIQIEQFTLLNENWYESVKALVLPKTISSSVFIKLLVNDDEETSFLYDEWISLYQIDDPNYLIETSINDSLEANYKHGLESIAKFKKINETSIEQLQLLQSRLVAEEEFVLFKKQLTNMVNQADLQLSPSLYLIDGKIQFIINLSKSDNRLVRLNENKQAYNALLTELQDYKKQLKKRQKLLANKIIILNQNELPSNASLAENLSEQEIAFFRESSVEIIENTKRLLEEKNSNIAKWHKSLSHFIEEIGHELRVIDKSYSQQTKDGYLQNIDSLNEQVKQDSIILHNENEIFLIAEKHYKSYLKSTYNPREIDIENKYKSKLSNLSEKISFLERKIIVNGGLIDDASINVESQEYSARAHDFDSMSKKLSQFHQIILDNKSLYFPINQISKNELMNCLEADDEIKNYIEDIYTKAESSASWKGINIANFINKTKHYTSFFTTSEFVNDADNIMLFINKKRQSIMMKRVSDKLLQLKKENELLENKKKNELLPYYEQKEILEHKCQLSQYELQLSAINYEQSLLTQNSYVFDYKLMSIDNKNEQLEKIIKNIEEEGTCDLMEQRTLVIALTDWTGFRENDSECSPLELNNKLEWTLSAIQKMWANLTNSPNSVPAILHAKKDALDKELSLIMYNQNKSANNYKLLETNVAINLLFLQWAPVINQCQDLSKRINEYNKVKVLSYQQQMQMLEKIDLVITSIASCELLAIPESIKNHDKVMAKIAMFDDFKKKFTDKRTTINLNLFLAELVPIQAQCSDLKEEIVVFEQLDSSSYEQQLELRDKITTMLEVLDKNENKYLENPIKTNDIFIKKMEELNQFKADFMQSKRSINDNLGKSLRDSYFGVSEKDGILNEYLDERASTYWKRDLFESFVSLITFFHFKPNLSERTSYISELKDMSNDYQLNPETHREAYLEKIQKGIDCFRPRKSGDSKSLCTKLQSLQEKVLLDTEDVTESYESPGL